MKSEIKRMYIVLGVMAALLVMVILLLFGNYLKQIRVYDEFKEKFNGETNTLVYIGRPTCGYCSLLEPSLLDMKERYNFDYIYVNIDEVNSSITSKILKDLGLNTVGTPYLSIVSNGKVVASQNGYVDYDGLFKFLQTNDIISDEAKLSLNYIGLEDYKKILAKDENSIVVVGQSTCSYCIKAKLVLNDIADKEETEINYLNVSYLTSNEQITEFQNTLEYLQSDWGTPVTLIVKGGKLVDVLEGYASETVYKEFFEKNGVL